MLLGAGRRGASKGDAHVEEGVGLRRSTDLPLTAPRTVRSHAGITITVTPSGPAVNSLTIFSLTIIASSR